MSESRDPVRRPTSSLSAFRGLRAETPGRVRRFDADWFGTVAISMAGVLGISLLFLVFGATTVVTSTSSLGGLAPTVVIRGTYIAVTTALVTALALGLIALWRGHVEGSGMRTRAIMAIGLSAILLAGVTTGGLGSDRVRRSDDGELLRPGWAAFGEIVVGDCLVDVPRDTYDVAERTYVVSCRLSHRAQVFGVIGGLDEAGPGAAELCTELATELQFEMAATDRLVAVQPSASHPTDQPSPAICLVAHAQSQVGILVRED